jgi:hypothetical protein
MTTVFPVCRYRIIRHSHGGLYGNPSHFHPTYAGNWRDLYCAALFETDNRRIPARIADAEKAIVSRARELFSADRDTIEEDQALDDALYALRALQSCLSLGAAA